MYYTLHIRRTEFKVQNLVFVLEIQGIKVKIEGAVII